MKFKSRNLKEIAECIIGDKEHFPYRSSSYITEFFEECDLLCYTALKILLMKFNI